MKKLTTICCAVMLFCTLHSFSQIEFLFNGQTYHNQDTLFIEVERNTVYAVQLTPADTTWRYSLKGKKVAFHSNWSDSASLSRMPHDQVWGNSIGPGQAFSHIKQYALGAYSSNIYMSLKFEPDCDDSTLFHYQYEVIGANYTDTLSTDTLNVILQFKGTTKFHPELIHQAGCDSVRLPSGSVVYESGSYVSNLPTIAGCDSILYSEVVIRKSSFDTLFVHELDSLYIGDSLINTSGIYDFTLQKSNGCDSNLRVYAVIEYAGILELQQALAEGVHPNPTKGTIHLPTGLTRVELMSMEGKILLIQESPVSNIDLAPFSSGPYLLKLQTKQGNSATVRVVKE